MSHPERPLVLLADDDPDDRHLTMEALEEAQVAAELECVEDGEALLRRLREPDARTPAFVLLDLNMPRKGGREALADIQADASLAAIPVIVLSTSQDPQDIAAAYALGASAFLTKPSSFTALVELLRDLANWWLGRADGAARGVTGPGRP
jgi:two-component system response regulator